MHDRWTERLSEYLDDELPLPDRQALEAHLAECATCRAVLVELGAVVARAGAVDDPPPQVELWDGIAARIGHRIPARRTPPPPAARPARSIARRVALSLPQLAAAAVVLLVTGAAGGWLAAPLLGGGDDGGVFVVTTPAPAPAAPLSALDAALAGNRGQLAPSTVRTLETNLAILDDAIADARRAADADPDDAYLQTHLADVMRRRVMLLQRAAALASAQT